MQSPSPSFRVTTHDGQIAAAAAGKGKVANLSDLVERFKGDIDTTPAGQISGDMVAASFDIHMTQYELRQAQEMEPQNVTLNVINRPRSITVPFSLTLQAWRAVPLGHAALFLRIKLSRLRRTAGCLCLLLSTTIPRPNAPYQSLRLPVLPQQTP